MKSSSGPKRLIAHHGGRRFVVEADTPESGWYLLVYEGERCTHDYLQDSADLAKQQASEAFGVPASAWIAGEIGNDDKTEGLGARGNGAS